MDIAEALDDYGYVLAGGLYTERIACTEPSVSPLTIDNISGGMEMIFALGPLVSFQCRPVLEVQTTGKPAKPVVFAGMYHGVRVTTTDGSRMPVKVTLLVNELAIDMSSTFTNDFVPVLWSPAGLYLQALDNYDIALHVTSPGVECEVELFFSTALPDPTPVHGTKFAFVADGPIVYLAFAGTQSRLNLVSDMNVRTAVLPDGGG